MMKPLLRPSARWVGNPSLRAKAAIEEGRHLLMEYITIAPQALLTMSTSSSLRSSPSTNDPSVATQILCMRAAALKHGASRLGRAAPISRAHASMQPSETLTAEWVCFPLTGRLWEMLPSSSGLRHLHGTRVRSLQLSQRHSQSSVCLAMKAPISFSAASQVHVSTLKMITSTSVLWRM